MSELTVGHTTHHMNKNKEDKTSQIPQRDKIKNELTIRPFDWTKKQQEMISLGLDKKTQVVFIKGPAGVSKTLISIYICLELLRQKKISDILYIRSAIESSDSHLGAMPGELEDKMSYYTIPLIDKINELLPKNQVDFLVKDKRVAGFPPNFARGCSWSVKGIVMDETQNSSLKEIMTILTRIGKFSKVFILADPTQSDLHNGKRGGFEKLYSLFSDDESKENGIYTFEFTEEDIVRSGLCQYIVKKTKNIQTG